MRHAHRLLALLLPAAIFCLNTGNAQTIPNAGFEDWPNGILSGWDTSNSPPTFSNVTKSTDAHSGSSALLGTVIDRGLGFGITPTLSTEPAFAVNSRLAALHGWYKTSLSGGDIFYVVVAFEKAGVGVGGATAAITASSTVYKEFVANSFFTAGDIPDSAIITMYIVGAAGFPKIGSSFLVDDLSWGAATDVKTAQSTSPLEFRLDQNYPNPFNPVTTIGYRVPGAQMGGGVSGTGSSLVRLSVYDLLGREVAVLVNEKLAPGSYSTTWNATAVSSGTYYYRLTISPDGGSQSTSFVQTRMMTLMR